ncbi:NADP-dependent malate dehydrogenase [Salmonella enterica subsp. enterica]|uniref:NADP-dependent malate dehydrogenase n=1 Tax=Salmonella enterica I TaxID=59201 RepID=A0A379W5L4_SALET|nr:NADP-dependent malate dehydrogenase [Salmonella enterica subsp. enterica]
MDEQLKQSALDFHEFPVPGKIQVSPTKPLATQRDLALAYSPGVAAPCLEIEKDPLAAYKYTARGNLVAVISNGTAVLGLGNIGALAGKPVMEGKGVLFKNSPASMCLTLKSMSLIRTNLSMWSQRWSRPLAALTLKTLKRRNVSILSRNCASA